MNCGPHTIFPFSNIGILAFRYLKDLLITARIQLAFAVTIAV